MERRPTEPRINIFKCDAGASEQTKIIIIKFKASEALFEKRSSIMDCGRNEPRRVGPSEIDKAFRVGS